MGTFYSVSCRNKACRYHVELYDGPGMWRFAWVKKLERKIKLGEKEVPEEIRTLLNTGKTLDCVANYLCPCCKEWTTRFDVPYVFEAKHVSPYGTIREYEVHYLYGQPKCEKCGADLVYILNPRSSKNKSPKCGTDNMRVGQYGYYD